MGVEFISKKTGKKQKGSSRIKIDVGEITLLQDEYAKQFAMLASRPLGVSFPTSSVSFAPPLLSVSPSSPRLLSRFFLLLSVVRATLWDPVEHQDEGSVLRTLSALRFFRSSIIQIPSLVFIIPPFPRHLHPSLRLLLFSNSGRRLHPFISRCSFHPSLLRSSQVL